MPLSRLVDWRWCYSPSDKWAGFLEQNRKRSLYSVVDLSRYSRSQLYRERLSSTLNNLPWSDSSRFLVDLDSGSVSFNSDYFTYQSLAAYSNNLVHLRT